MCPCYLKIILIEENKRVPTLAFYYTCNSTNFWYKWNRTFIPMRFIAIPVSKILLLVLFKQDCGFLELPFSYRRQKQKDFWVLTSQILTLCRKQYQPGRWPDPVPCWVAHSWQATSRGHMAPCQVEHPGRSYRRAACLPLPFTVTTTWALWGHASSPTLLPLQQAHCQTLWVNAALSPITGPLSPS